MNEIIDELLLIQKVEARLEQSKNDDVISDDELTKELTERLS